MKARDPYHAALTALAGFAGSGRFGWGRPLVATALANELGLSPTPVREALARLSGEGLIEHRPGRGYHAPSPGPDDIADLYELHHRLIQWALEPQGAVGGPPHATEPIDQTAEALFAAIARGSGRGVLTRSHWRVTLQLRPIRIVEAEVAPTDPAWPKRAWTLAVEGRLDDLCAEIDGYHRARIAAASGVAAVMRRSGESIDRI